MKSGKHPEKALTAVQVRQLKTAGRYADGNGLYLVVDPSGAKRWLLRTVVQGKRTDIGLGGLSLLTLAEAREMATDYRKIARSGGDPLAARRLAAKVVPTFQKAAEQVHEDHKASWSNGKHQQQWINTLETYAFPSIGSKPVDQIATPDVLAILSPIWLTKPETARRVRQRISAVMAWAKRSAFRDAIVVAGWDVSWNTFENEPEGWNLHLYLLINLPYSETLKRQIVKAFRLSSSAMRPKSIKPVKEGAVNFLTALTYCHKVSFDWRSGYFEKRLKTDGNPRKRVKNLPLKPEQQLELLSWLSQCAVGTRLIMRNIKRRNPPWAKMRLDLLKPIILPAPA